MAVFDELESTDGVKKLEELDLNQLAHGVAELIEKQVGGKVDVLLSKFERNGLNGLNARLSIAFEVTDQSATTRMIKYSAAFNRRHNQPG